MKNKLLIIIPAYNEEKNIGAFIKKLKEAKIEALGDILVINDGSIDDTEDVVKSYGIDILNKPLNMGYGSTLQLGYKYAKRYDYEYIIQIDADGQHDVSNINVIYDVLVKDSEDQSKPDIVIGSRFLSEENEMEVSIIKKFAIKFFRLIIKVFTGKTITDPTSGMQGLNKKAFSHYALYGNFDYRYPDINMIIQMAMLGYKIEEVPAKMYYRNQGKSMHSGIFKPIAYMVLMSLSILTIVLRQKKSEFKNKDEKKDKENKSIKDEQVKEETQIDTQTYMGLASIIVLLFVLMFIITNLDNYIRESKDNIETSEYKDLERKKEIDVIERENISDSFNLVVEKGYKVEDALKQAKIPYKVSRSLKDIKSFQDNLILDGSMIKDQEDFDIVKKFISEEKNIIFLSTPKVKYFAEFDLRDILGINSLYGEIDQDELNITPGFMLGGMHELEKLPYKALNVDLLYSTKVYAYGKDDLPIIWRNTNENSGIYVVNGPFMEGNASYGILSSIMSEIYEDYIYPVVNARFMAYEGFPFISNENKENLNSLYNRGAMKFQYDILMPNILTLNSRRNFIGNGYFSLGFKDNSIENINAHRIKQVNNIRDQIYTSGGDVNLRYTGDLKRDKKAYEKIFKDEKIKSLMVDEKPKDLRELVKSIEALESVVGPWGEDDTFKYINDKVVYIPTTASGSSFNSQDKLQFLSGVTAFGAVVQSLSLEELVLNDGDKENWTGISKTYSRFLDDYRERFEFLKSRNTASTTRAVKAYKNSNPTIETKEDKIGLTFKKWNGPTYFILRTDKEVVSIAGGEAQIIEENAYLLTVNEKNVDIGLKRSENTKAKR